MSETGVREIQLSGKQLVFLFMASVIVAVGIFLLGVSVGRGVRGATGAAASAAAAPGEMASAEPVPPAVNPEPQDLRYHDQLQGQPAQSAPPSAAEPKASAGPPPEAPPVDEPQQPSAATASTPPASAPVPEAGPRSAAAPPVAADAASTSGFSIQVGAFRSRDNANRQVAQLKSEGLPAFIVNSQNALFSVRVGPYPERPEAERVAARLSDKFPGAKIIR